MSAIRLSSVNFLPFSAGKMPDKFQIYISSSPAGFMRDKLSFRDKKRLYKFPNLAQNPDFIHSRAIIIKNRLTRKKYCISHKDGVAVILRAKGKFGIDIEALRIRKFERLAELCFNQTEREILSNSDNKMLCFYQIYTLKEAIIKASNDTLWNMKNFGINRGLNLCDKFGKRYKFNTFKFDNFLISAVY